MDCKCQKCNYKKFPVFYHKIKTRTYIKNLRHRSLHLGVINNESKFHRYPCRGKGNIDIKKILVKICLKTKYFQKFEVGKNILFFHIIEYMISFNLMYSIQEMDT